MKLKILQHHHSLLYYLPPISLLLSNQPLGRITCSSHPSSHLTPHPAPSGFLTTALAKAATKGLWILHSKALFQSQSWLLSRIQCC